MDFVVACTVTDIRHPVPPTCRGTRQFTYGDVLDALGPRTTTLQQALEEQEFRSRMAEREAWCRRMGSLDLYPRW